MKNKDKRQKRAVAFAFTLTAAVMITLASAAYLPIKERSLYKSVIRLHVIANSDTESDQSLKLAVRDALLADARSAFEGEDLGSAIRIVNGSAPRIQAVAERVVAERGASYPVRVVFGEEEYPQREYGDRIYPAGKYLSLRVIIGEGKGKNWWCVLFPPLCLGSSRTTGGDGENDSGGERPAIAQNTPRIRIKLLEWFGFY